MASGFPDWQRAVAVAKAPHLPSASPPEERFNQSHGFHGEFAAGAGATAAKGGEGGGEPPESGKKQKQESVQKQQLLNRAQTFRDLANQLRAQLNGVQAQLSYANQPFTPSGAITGAIGGGQAGAKAAGAPNPSAAAQGTKSFGAGTKSFGTGTGPTQQGPAAGQTWAQYTAGLQNQAAQLREQIHMFDNRANVLTAKANAL